MIAIVYLLLLNGQRDNIINPYFVYIVHQTICIIQMQFVPNKRIVLQSTKILLLPSKCEIIFITLQKWKFFQYCDSNIGLFFIAPHLVIALPTLRQQKLSLLISLYEFCRLVMASFLYCFPYSYRSSNYCDSNSCRSFTLLQALAKSNSNLFAIAFKSEKERQLSLSRQLEER